MSQTIDIYTDGSALGNPGKSGFAYLLINRKNKMVTEYGEFHEHATNNQMEMMALESALKKICELPKGENIVIHLDSEYVKNGITKWIVNWKKNGWKTANKKPVLNKDIWMKIDEVYEKAKELHEINLKYVPGHMGIDGNEIVDTIARTLAGGESWEFFHGDIDEFKALRNIKI